MTVPARWMVVFALVSVLGLAIGCDGGSGAGATPPSSRSARDPAAGSAPSDPLLVDVTLEAGIDFRHVTGGSGKKFLFETMGAGVAIADFDGDDLPDLLFLQSGTLSLEEFPDRRRARHLANEHARLYRNQGDFTFEDVTAGSGLEVAFYAHGVAVGDIDGDGDRDVFAAAFGRDRLFVNDGTGHFEERGVAAGVADPRWTLGGSFFDADADGDLDLYAVAYLDMPVESHQVCGPSRELRSFCHVDFWGGLDDRLYLNDGTGTFTDASAEAGLGGSAGKGLAVVAADLDDDGLPDLFVANDSSPNLLLRNLGGGKFEDISRWSGSDLNSEGHTEACMGIAAGDLDGDGDVDLYVTNFEQETNTLYRNDGRGLFTDVSTRSGAGVPSMAELGFGTVALDLENDGDLDLYVANGHIMDNVEEWQEVTTYAQRDQLYLNDGTGRFKLGDPGLSPSTSLPRVGRGVATGDLDGDGDLDLVVTHVGDRPWVLRNDASTGHRLALRLSGPGARADAEGARVTVTLGDRTIMREHTPGTSYASAVDGEFIIGLGDATAVDSVSVRWPDGRSTDLGALEVDTRHFVGWDGTVSRTESLGPPGGR